MSSGMSLNGKEIFESDWLGSIDLGGKDLTVKIALVEKAEVFNPKTNAKSMKLAFRFDGQAKGMICNRTNATTISKLYGTEASAWTGKQITLYPTTCKVGRETTTCLRVREKVPGGQQAPAGDKPKSDHPRGPHGSPDGTITPPPKQELKPAELTLVQKYAKRIAELKPEEISAAYKKFDEQAATMPDEIAQQIYAEFAKYAPQQSKEPVI